MTDNKKKRDMSKEPDTVMGDPNWRRFVDGVPKLVSFIDPETGKKCSTKEELKAEYKKRGMKWQE